MMKREREEEPKARTKLGNCMIFMWPLCEKDEKKGFYRVSPRTELSAIPKCFGQVAPLFHFYFCLVHKNTTERQLEQFKKYS